MEKKSLSVIMPVFNEKNTIMKIVEKVLKLGIVKELIVVDDCSTDGTRDLLKDAKFDARVRIFYHDRNK
ncbi:MAG: glycosyltransferase, partial [Candidatus Omnitrophica bacterium]|nr:glycosyltransferase [Candidatus Omnitrophota bacterium]